MQIFPVIKEIACIEHIWLVRFWVLSEVYCIFNLFLFRHLGWEFWHIQENVTRLLAIEQEKVTMLGVTHLLWSSKRDKSEFKFFFEKKFWNGNNSRKCQHPYCASRLALWSRLVFCFWPSTSVWWIWHRIGHCLRTHPVSRPDAISWLFCHTYSDLDGHYCKPWRMNALAQQRRRRISMTFLWILKIYRDQL